MTMDTKAADAMFALHGDVDVTNMTIAKLTDIVTAHANQKHRVKARETDKVKDEAKLDGLRATRKQLDTKDELARAIAQVKAKLAMRDQAKLAAEPARPRACTDNNEREAKLTEDSERRRARSDLDPAKAVGPSAGPRARAGLGASLAKLFDPARRATRWPRGELDEWEQARDLDLQMKMPSLRRAAEKVIARWQNRDEDDSSYSSEDERRPTRVDPRQQRRMAWEKKRSAEDVERKNKELERPELIRELLEPKVRLAAVTEDKDVMVSDALRQQVVNSWVPIEKEAKDDARTLKFSECGRCLFVQKFWTCEVLCSATGRLLTQIGRDDEAELLFALVSPNGRQVATVDQKDDGSSDVTLWDMQNTHRSRRWLHADDALKWASFSPDSSKLATGSHMGRVAIWSVETGKRLPEVEEMEHEDEVMGVRWSTDGLHLTTIQSGGLAALWDATTGRRLRTLWAQASRWHPGFLDHVYFSPDGSYVMRRRPLEPRICVYSGASGELMHEIRTTSHIRQARFSPDGLHIMLVADSGLEVRLAATGEMVVDHRQARAAAFLPLTPAPWWPKPAADA